MHGGDFFSAARLLLVLILFKDELNVSPELFVTNKILCFNNVNLMTFLASRLVTQPSIIITLISKETDC